MKLLRAKNKLIISWYQKEKKSLKLAKKTPVRERHIIFPLLLWGFWCFFFGYNPSQSNHFSIYGIIEPFSTKKKKNLKRVKIVYQMSLKSFFLSKYLFNCSIPKFFSSYIWHDTTMFRLLACNWTVCLNLAAWHVL